MISRFPLLKVPIKMISWGLYIKLRFEDVDRWSKRWTGKNRFPELIDWPYCGPYARYRKQEAKEEKQEEKATSKKRCSHGKTERNWLSDSRLPKKFNQLDNKSKDWQEIQAKMYSQWNMGSTAEAIAQRNQWKLNSFKMTIVEISITYLL